MEPRGRAQLKWPFRAKGVLPEVGPLAALCEGFSGVPGHEKGGRHDDEHAYLLLARWTGLGYYSA